MLGGYMGKFLWVDLATGAMRVETPDEALLRDFVGGYGVAARLYYDRMSAGVDPLGPDNILGFITGPLTGSPAPTGCRWTVTCKSPLTGGWGDANCGGFFGPSLKASGYDLPENSTRAGSECDANANLRGPLGHRVCHHTVHACQCEHERDDRKCG